MAPRKPFAGQIVERSHAKHPVVSRDIMNQQKRHLALGGDPDQALNRWLSGVGVLGVELVLYQSGEFAPVILQHQVRVEGGDIAASFAVLRGQGGAAVAEDFGIGHGQGSLVGLKVTRLA